MPIAAGTLGHEVLDNVAELFFGALGVFGYSIIHPDRFNWHPLEGDALAGGLPVSKVVDFFGICTAWVLSLLSLGCALLVSDRVHGAGNIAVVVFAFLAGFVVTQYVLRLGVIGFWTCAGYKRFAIRVVPICLFAGKIWVSSV